MALVKTDSSIVSIRGRVGGVYFKHDGSGQHLQKMPRHVNYTRHGVQLTYTSQYSDGAGLWLLALLLYFSAAWAAYGLVHLFTDKHGVKKRITGYNWYIHYALTFPERDEFHPFWKPPHAPGDLPDYVAVYQGKWTYYNNPEVWPFDCCSGYYWDSGHTWNGKPTYQTDDFEWHIWWTGVEWCVSPSHDYEPPDKSFYSRGPEINAWYLNPVTNKRAHVYAGKRPGY